METFSVLSGMIDMQAFFVSIKDKNECQKWNRKHILTFYMDCVHGVIPSPHIMHKYKSSKQYTASLEQWSDHFMAPNNVGTNNGSN
jgi:hypothetical protein